MFDLNAQQKEFLNRFGKTGNGRDMITLLKTIAANVDKTSNIPAGSDYGAQVEGRKLLATMITNILKEMSRKPVIHSGEQKGTDDYD